jgi:hypothetical protein
MVRSTLPSWDVVMECPILEGEAGTLSPQQILIRTERTGGRFVPLAGPVPILSGDLRLPERETVVEIAVVPSWMDLAGTYRGRLLFRCPQWAADQPAVELAQWNKRSSVHAEHSVPIIVRLDEAIHVAILDRDMRIKNAGLPGSYYAEPDMRFTVTTNAAVWRVECRITDLQGVPNTLSADRINWQLIGTDGQVISRGNLISSSVVLWGNGPASHLEYSLRFFIITSTGDPSGDYLGKIGLAGIIDAGESRKPGSPRRNLIRR